MTASPGKFTKLWLGCPGFDRNFFRFYTNQFSLALSPFRKQNEELTLNSLEIFIRFSVKRFSLTFPCFEQRPKWAAHPNCYTLEKCLFWNMTPEDNMNFHTSPQIDATFKCSVQTSQSLVPLLALGNRNKKSLFCYICPTLELPCWLWQSVSLSFFAEHFYYTVKKVMNFPVSSQDVYPNSSEK